MLLQKYQTTHSYDLEETVAAIRSRNPYFSNIRASADPRWRYKFNRVTLNTVKLGISEVTSLQYKSDYSDDIVITACFNGLETQSTRKDSRSLSRLPAFAPNFPTEGLIKKASFYTVRLSPTLLLHYISELELDVDLKSFIERFWLQPLENSVNFNNFISTIFLHIENTDFMLDREKNSIEDLIYLNAARLIASHSRRTSLSSGEKVFQRCADFINEHLSEDLTLLDISKAAGMSIRSVQLLFRRYVNMTITEYLTNRRLEKAHQLLKSKSKISIQEVAFAVGVPNLSYFGRLYKRKYGEAASVTLRTQ